MEEEVTTPPLVAVSGIIFSTSLMAVASGFLFAYIPIKLAALGFEPWVRSSMMPALAFGGVFGCLATGAMLRLTGHARVFVTLYAFIILSILILAASENPLFWLLSRALYGFAINGVFIVAQSWIHDATTDDQRGTLITIFYVSYVLSLGMGSYAIGFVDIGVNEGLLISIFFVTAAILPFGFTRLQQPPPPDSISIDVKKVWKISPVGLTAMLAVGGLTMTVQSFAPIYASELGYMQSDIGLLMFLMQVGLLVIQLPMGAISDRTDRRYVLVFVAFSATTASLLMLSGHPGLSLVSLILIFALWSGSVETFYSVSNALANDRADPKHYVMLSSTLMVAWSVSGFIVPLAVTFAIQWFDITAFMVIGGVISATFAVFVIYRIYKRDAVVVEEMETFQTTSAQVPYYAEILPYDEDSKRNAGNSEGLI